MSQKRPASSRPDPAHDRSTRPKAPKFHHLNTLIPISAVPASVFMKMILVLGWSGFSAPAHGGYMKNMWTMLLEVKMVRKNSALCVYLLFRYFQFCKLLIFLLY